MQQMIGRYEGADQCLPAVCCSLLVKQTVRGDTKFSEGALVLSSSDLISENPGKLVKERT